MNKAFPKQTEQAQPKHKRGRTESITLFTYRLKIIAGMAAALIMLILIPLQAEADMTADDAARHQKRSEAMEEKYRNSDGSNVNNLLNEGTRRIGDKINSWLGITEEYPVNSLFEMMNGGNHYEN